MEKREQFLTIVLFVLLIVIAFYSAYNYLKVDDLTGCDEEYETYEEVNETLNDTIEEEYSEDINVSLAVVNSTNVTG